MYVIRNYRIHESVKNKGLKIRNKKKSEDGEGGVTGNRI